MPARRAGNFQPRFHESLAPGGAPKSFAGRGPACQRREASGQALCDAPLRAFSGGRCELFLALLLFAQPKDMVGIPGEWISEPMATEALAEAG